MLQCKVGEVLADSGCCLPEITVVTTPMTVLLLCLMLRVLNSIGCDYSRTFEDELRRTVSLAAMQLNVPIH